MSGMIGWQDGAVGALLLLCAVLISRSIYSFFRRTKETGNPCDSCASACELKRLLDEKRAKCSDAQKKKKKSCPK